MTTLEDPTKLFTNDWIITLPTHPHLKFHRCSPSFLPAYFSILTNPANWPSGPPMMQFYRWTPDKLEAETLKMTSNYNSRSTSLVLLVSSNNEWVGRGALDKQDNEAANLGIQLTTAGRGKGVGTATVELLLRLACEMNVKGVEAGTMKANGAMRAVFRKLGLEETERESSIPSVGVISEIQYLNVPVEKWAGLKFHLEVLETGPRDKESS